MAFLRKTILSKIKEVAETATQEINTRLENFEASIGCGGAGERAASRQAYDKATSEKELPNEI